jgi:hypothetical protein
MAEHDPAPPIPLEEAVAVLSRVAASAAPAVDARATHLRAVRALDALAARGLAVPPERIVPLLQDGSLALLDLFVSILLESQAASHAVMERARVFTSEVGGNVCEDAANAHGARRALVTPAERIGAYLPREIALQNDFRREELVRAWAAEIGAPLEVKGKREKSDKSARALEKLDYRKIRADEERLAIERKVLAEHAEKVRERQRQREAEALASAQRE